MRKMATKKTVKEAAKAEPAKREVKQSETVKAPKEAEGKRDLMVMLLVVGAIAVVLILIAYLMMAQGGGKLPAFGDVVSGMVGALTEIKTGTVDFEATMDMSLQGQQMSMGMESVAKFDVPAKKMYSLSSMSMGFAEQSVEMYTIGNFSYMKMNDPYTGEESWIKTQADLSTFDLLTADMDELLGTIEGNVVGEGKINGKEAYKLEVKPDIAKLIDYVIKSQDLGSAGVSQADIDRAVGQLVNSVKKLDLTVWVLKESYLPIKAQGEVTMSMDLGSMSTAASMLGTVDLSISFTADVDYEKPVVIELPEEARDAQDITNLYGLEEAQCGDGICDYTEDETICPEDCAAVCGDGWCDWEENETSCPEDCTSVCGDYWCDWDENETSCPEDCAVVCGDGWCDWEENETSCPEDCGPETEDLLVGNDTDEHGCIGSAGYSWCESKGKCLRMWEEDCPE